jgi:protein-S-isoprenylcysteine O-methyltransferase Ste14
LLLGTALAVPSIPAIFGVLLFAGSALVQVRSEERELRRTLGPAYDIYCQSVPRWIGIRERSLQ